MWRFGSVVPASVIAKAAAADPWTLSFQSLYAYFLQGLYLPLTLLAVVGSLTNTGASPFWRLFAIWAWSYIAAMTARNAFTHFPWYFVPLLPVYTGKRGTGPRAIGCSLRIFRQLHAHAGRTNGTRGLPRHRAC